jgi:hypothetical protein
LENTPQNTEIRDESEGSVVGGPPRHRRTFAWTYLLALGFVTALIIAINWLGNGSGCFDSPLRPSPKDRAYKTRCLDELVAEHRGPKILILGSSRSMQFKPDYFMAITGKRTFNYAVIGGNPIDCLTQLQYALSVGAKPEILVVDITGWEIDAEGGQRFLAANSRLAAFIPERERLAVFGAVFRSIDMHSTVASLRALLRGAMRGNGKDDPALIDGEIVIMKDGYRFNWKLTDEKAKGRFDLAAVVDNRIEADRIFRANATADPSPQRSRRWLECLREFLSKANAEGIEVHLITTPEHPKFRAAFSTDASIASHDDLIRTLESECAKFGAHFHDFTDLNSFGGSADEFWDQCHQTPVNMDRMADALFGVPASAKKVHVPTDVEIIKVIRGN